jgi:hypothetical protein
MLSGLMYGAWIDGASLGVVALYLAMFLAALTGIIWLINRRSEDSVAVAHS